jgi:hypothetical protein
MKVGYPDTMNSMHSPLKAIDDQKRKKGANYKDDDDIDESDFEALNTGLNVQDVNSIKSDNRGQYITSKRFKDSPYVDEARQDTIRPTKGKYFKMGWGDSDDTDQALYGKGGYIPEGHPDGKKLKKKD